MERACQSLCALVKTVLQQLSAEHKALVLERPVLRGVIASQLRLQLEQMLNVATAGAISKLDDSLSSLVAPAREFQQVQGPAAALDVYKGLEKLCSSVSRAQRYFASVEPPVVSFNHTLLLLVLPRQNIGMFEYEWRKCADIVVWWLFFC